MDDDHYIANAKNAHLDTSEFEVEIFSRLRGNPEISDDVLVELIYNLAFSKIAVPPVEPTDDQLICRYLSPAKFIKFLDGREIIFSAATKFSDKWECSIPEDYNNAVLRIFSELKRPGIIWENFVKSLVPTWKVSCWTKLNDHFDDHLMWKTYAEGSDGSGITVRYGQLKNHLSKSVRKLDSEIKFYSGGVNYGGISLLPFNKHNIFRNENEVRFAFQSSESNLVPISVDEIFSLFGVRISPSAEPGYAEVIRRMWLKYGGDDRIQHST